LTVEPALLISKAPSEKITRSKILGLPCEAWTIAARHGNSV